MQKEIPELNVSLPSSHPLPAAAACCSGAGCQSSSGWRCDARAGQEEGTRSDPEGQPRCRRGWWHSRPECARLNARRGRAFYFPSAPEEKRGERSELRPCDETKLKINNPQNMLELKEQSVVTNLHSSQFNLIWQSQNRLPHTNS